MDETPVKENVGLKIRKYRQALKLTQFKLGELIDINQRQIAQIECGKSFPSLQTMLKMAEVFQCELSDFFEFNDGKNEKFLKSKLKSIIDKAGYDDCVRIYEVIKAFVLI